MHHLLKEYLNPDLIVNFILSDLGIDDLKQSKIAKHALLCCLHTHAHENLPYKNEFIVI